MHAFPRKPRIVHECRCGRTENFLGGGADERKSLDAIRGALVLIDQPRHHGRDLFETVITGAQFTLGVDDVRDVGDAEHDGLELSAESEQGGGIHRDQLAFAVGPLDTVAHIEHRFTRRQDPVEGALFIRPRPAIQVSGFPLRSFESAPRHMRGDRRGLQSENGFGACIRKNRCLVQVDHDHAGDAGRENTFEQITLGAMLSRVLISRVAKLLHASECACKPRFTSKGAKAGPPIRARQCGELKGDEEGRPQAILVRRDGAQCPISGIKQRKGDGAPTGE